MAFHPVIIWVVIGLLAGWLASFVVGGGGLIRYLVSGLLGSVVGSLLVRWTGFYPPIGNAFVYQVVVATIGAIVLILLARLIA